MPQLGERRSGSSETVEWNGARWIPVEAPHEAPQEGALSRFFGGAASTSPLNPMNLAHAVAHPIDTIGHAIGDPLNNLFKVPGDLKDVVTNERGGGPLMGRVTSAIEAAKHLGGSVPLIGPAGVNAGEKMGEGDIAGGAGELAGLASSALAPKIAPKVPGALTTAGDAMTRGGQAMKSAGGVSIGGVHVPLSTLGIAEAALRRDPMGLAVAAAPYALEYGGKGLSAAGRGLEGLRSFLMDEPTEQPKWDPAGPSMRAKSEAAQQAAREAASGVSPEDFGTATMNYRGDPLTPFAKTQGITQAFGRETLNFTPKAETMGRRSVQKFQDAGYDVDNGGFRSTRDIDRLAKGPDPAAAAEALRRLREPPAGSPSFADITGSLDRTIARSRGMVDEMADVPAFEHSAGAADIPGSTIGEMGESLMPEQDVETAMAGERQARQQASLKALMDLPSFRRMR